MLAKRLIEVERPIERCCPEEDTRRRVPARTEFLSLFLLLLLTPLIELDRSELF